MSYKLGSYLKSQNPKWTSALNRPRSDDDCGSTTPPKLPEISPKHEDAAIYKTPERIRKAQPEIEKSTKTHGGVFQNSPHGRGRKMARTPHSGHKTDSKREHSNHPPPGNKTPNCRAADRGKKRRERGDELSVMVLHTF